MRYFKTLDENGNLLRLDACTINPCNGIEITEEEYNQLLSEIKFDITNLDIETEFNEFIIE